MNQKPQLNVTTPFLTVSDSFIFSSFTPGFPTARGLLACSSRSCNRSRPTPRPESNTETAIASPSTRGFRPRLAIGRGTSLRSRRRRPAPDPRRRPDPETPRFSWGRISRRTPPRTGSARPSCRSPKTPARTARTSSAAGKAGARCQRCTAKSFCSCSVCRTRNRRSTQRSRLQIGLGRYAKHRRPGGRSRTEAASRWIRDSRGGFPCCRPGSSPRWSRSNPACSCAMGPRRRGNWLEVADVDVVGLVLRGRCG
mmetsp:Transcript_8095/g.19576  ORF Transcript_8095/g.19576 Transcript_8095/m.19576 type:complete len:254 (-) Transcript_8095:397-1158(-)